MDCICIKNSNINYSELIANINEEVLRYYLETITSDFKGRVTGSDICYEAADWISSEFSKSEHLNVRMHNWIARAGFCNYLKLYSCVNVEAELPGTNPDAAIIIFSAHFDSDEANSPGALDNGAGVAALLAAANALSEYQFNNTIRFVAFSGEELQILGSYEYVKEIYEKDENIAAVINADVIANNTHKTKVFHQLRAFTTYSLRPIIDIFNKASLDNQISIQVEERNYHGNSDDKSFNDYGYPSMQLFQSGNAMEHLYGKENDTIDLINFSYLTKVCQCIATGIAYMADDDKIIPKIEIEIPQEDKFFYNNIPLFTLNKGSTVIIGPVSVNAEKVYESSSIDKVEFSLITGFSEYETSNGEQIVVENVTDFSPPYECIFDVRCFGRFTVRVSAFEKNGNVTHDEIELFIINT